MSSQTAIPVSQAAATRNAEIPPKPLLLNTLFGQPALAICGLVLLLLVGPLLVTYAMETRTVLDTNVWLKPIKFALALTIYTFTLSWYASYLGTDIRQSRRFIVFNQIVVICIVLEMAWLIYASLLGEAAHFNQTHPILTPLYFIMGLIATVLTAITLVMALGFRQRANSHVHGAVRVSLMLGLGLTFVLTMITAWYMAASPLQSHTILSAASAGNETSGNSKIAFFGWSRNEGDLRVAHFFATHAMHFIPAVGWLIGRCLPSKAAIVIIWFTAVIYAGFVGFVFFQAVGGEPFIGV